jgi:hypothetical protein
VDQVIGVVAIVLLGITVPLVMRSTNAFIEYDALRRRAGLPPAESGRGLFGSPGALLRREDDPMLDAARRKALGRLLLAVGFVIALAVFTVALYSPTRL